MKIVVLAGGISSERNVSLSTGIMVCEALRGRGHSVAFVDMYLGNEGYPEPVGDLFAAAIPSQLRAVGRVAPDVAKLRASRRAGGKSLFGPGVLEICAQADMVFLALHGSCGEDGRVQAAFDLLGIPYTGSGYLGSALAMDKDITKRLLSNAGVQTPYWYTVSVDAGNVDALHESIKVPCVIKVLRGGSSLGVSIVKTRGELAAALQGCLVYDSTLLVEEYIEGREFTCAVLEDTALPTVEIVPQVDFYDYESKYQPGATLEICPGRASEELEANIRKTALAAHRALGLAVYSRSDFMVDAQDRVYFLEINTLPGMTPTSLVPQEAAAAGLDYGALCERIIAASVRAREV